MRRAGYSGLLVLVLAGCGPTDGSSPRARLEGSLGQVLSLGYDSVRVLISPLTDVAVLFVRERPSSAADAGAALNEDYPFKVTVKLLGEPLVAGARVDLAMQLEDGSQRGLFSREVLNDPRKLFPRAQRSTLSFNQVPVVGGRVSGDFHVTFENGIEPASGRTVFGSFEARVNEK